MTTGRPANPKRPPPPPRESGDPGPASSSAPSVSLGELAAAHRALPDGPPKILIAKPGLDGHSNGAEQIALAARDAGMEVVYQGIRRTPGQIAATARDEDVDLVGLSILSGSHVELVPEVVAELHRAGIEVPVVAGGIIPEPDRSRLEAAGVARVYTPRDFDLTALMGELSELALGHRDDRVGRQG